MASFTQYLLTTLLSLFLLSPPSSSTPTTVTLILTPSTTHKSTSPLQTITHLASLSLSRAHHLKSPKRSNHAKSNPIKTPLYSRSYGGYSVKLSFGTPPQSLQFVMDTGSSLVWFPCTSRYRCSDCNFRNVNSSNIPSFIPKLSSSSKLVGCQNPKCSFVFGPTVKSKCDCESNTKNCTQTCPPYIIQYGLGSTAGLLLLENLVFPEKTLTDFLVGCSIASNRQPEGIAGFGRGPESIPSQMGLNKFSYCLIPRVFDDSPVSSDLVLYLNEDHKANKSDSISYTPFLKNPNKSILAFREYYYVTLRKIVVGGKHVKIPYKLLVPGSDGNGGTIVDSGSTFTFMEMPVFDLVATEFEKQLIANNYTIATDIQTQTGLRPCFDVPGSGSVLVPEIVFQFKGGAKLHLPSENYLAFVDSGIACMTIVTNGGQAGPAGGLGPAIILGSFQQQNYYVEYDLKNERFGFKQQNCV